MIRALAEERGCTILPMSTVSEEGINDVKTVACNLLLEHRVERKTAKLATRSEEILGRINVARPTPRDDKVRWRASWLQ